MIVHENVELLSSFVDDELNRRERQAVESHLADCLPCRERIGALRRVVAELRSLEVVAPPAGLSGRVRRAVLVGGKRDSVLQRSADSLRRWTDQPLLLPLFGVVTALAVLLYLFSAWSERVEHPGTRLVVGTEDAVVRPVAEGLVVEVAERRFERTDGRWVERGIDASAVVRTIDLRQPDPAWTMLEPFRPLGDRVVLFAGKEPVEVVFGDDPGLSPK